MINNNYNQVDKEQLKLLLKTALKLDWRGSTNPFTVFQDKKSKFPGIVVIMLFNILYSIVFGFVFLSSQSIVTSLVLSATGSSVFIGMQLLIEYSHIIISPHDYHIIGPQPVNSKTFFLSKLYHLLIYISVLTASFAIIPSLMAAYSFGIIYLPVVWIHFLVVNFFITVLIMNLYSFFMKIVNRRKIERVLLYIQSIAFLILMMGMSSIPAYIKELLTQNSFDLSEWLKILPAYWFAAPVKLITNGWDLQTFLLFVGGAIFFILLWKFAVSFLSLSYSETLNKMDSSVKKKKRIIPAPIKKLWNKLFSFEGRALQLLIWSEFKHNAKFKMQILWMLPVLAVSLFFGAGRDAKIMNPFELVLEGESNNYVLGFVIVFCPLMIMFATQYSKDWKAAAVFHYSQTDKVKMIEALKKIITYLIIIPFGLIFVVLFYFKFDNPFHAIMYGLFFIPIGLIILNVITCFSVRLPFSAFQQNSGAFTAEGFIPFLAMGLLFIPLTIVENRGFDSVTGWLYYMIVLMAVNIVLWRIAAKRISKKTIDLEFVE